MVSGPCPGCGQRSGAATGTAGRTEHAADRPRQGDRGGRGATRRAIYSPPRRRPSRTFYRTLENIREDRTALNDRKIEAKAALQEHCPDADMVSVMIAYNIYIAAETEAAAASQMRRVADTVKDVAGIYQPSLF